MKPSPQNPPTPTPLFQQFGPMLRLSPGSITLIYLNPNGVELILSSSLSICICSHHIREQGVPSNQVFADLVEMGQSFPTLTIDLKPSPNFMPRLISDPFWMERPSKPSSSEANGGGDSDGVTLAPPQVYPRPPKPHSVTCLHDPSLSPVSRPANGGGIGGK
ncbi:MAG: hypothetical protein PHQ12_11785 [Chthoniobacteraceae bacterium]|nr:hypothetical protein [Chthoniobacteraceae bacterium]